VLYTSLIDIPDLFFSVPTIVHGAANVNTFAIHGNGQEKDLTELVPGILPQLGAESIANLRRLASSLGVRGFLSY
jgi:nascent polypeptide-associated complex subunit beta